MKKHFSLFCGLMAVCFISRAQIKQGATLVGGNLSLYTSSEKNAPPGYLSKSTTFSVNPYFGKAIKQDFIVGFDLLYGHNSNNGSFETGNQYGAGVFIRRYKYLGNRFYVFLQAGLKGEYDTDKQTVSSTPSYESDTKGFGIKLYVYPGLSYAVSEKWHLELAMPNLAYLQYGHSKGTVTPSSAGENTSYNSFSMETSLSTPNALSLGVSFLLNR